MFSLLWDIGRRFIRIEYFNRSFSSLFFAIIFGLFLNEYFHKRQVKTKMDSQQDERDEEHYNVWLFSRFVQNDFLKRIFYSEIHSLLFFKQDCRESILLPTSNLSVVQRIFQKTCSNAITKNVFLIRFSQWTNCWKQRRRFWKNSYCVVCTWSLLRFVKY